MRRAIQVFSRVASREAQQDRIVAITAAMPGGRGATYLERHSQTGSRQHCRQHAVTFAAGPREGYKPFAAIYSTFLQRAYDQVVHDVAVQNLRFDFIDRAGVVGADSATHQGAFDVSYLCCLPNMTVIPLPTRLNSHMPSPQRQPIIPVPLLFGIHGEGVGLPFRKPCLAHRKGTNSSPRTGCCDPRPRPFAHVPNAVDTDGAGHIADTRCPLCKPLDLDLLHLWPAITALFLSLKRRLGGFAAGLACSLYRGLFRRLLNAARSASRPVYRA